jgi:hypothetical protein
VEKETKVGLTAVPGPVAGSKADFDFNELAANGRVGREKKT